MGRRYNVLFEQQNLTSTTGVDLVQVKGASGKLLKIIEVWWGVTDTTLVTSQSIATRCRYLPATVTDGNGSAGTQSKLDPGDAAASFTSLILNTTKATTGGTAIVNHESGDFILTGYTWTFNSSPVIGPSESFVFEILSTVSGTVHMSGGVLVEEMGG